MKSILKFIGLCLLLIAPAYAATKEGYESDPANLNVSMECEYMKARQLPVSPGFEVPAPASGPVANVVVQNIK